MTSASSWMDRADLPIVEEIPAEDFSLSADKIKTAQQKIVGMSEFLSCKYLLFVASTYLCNRLVG